MTKNIDNQVDVTVEKDMSCQLESTYVAMLEDANKTIALLKEQQEKNEKNILYLRAEIENIKKTSLRDVMLARERELIRVINPFLNVFDDIKRTLEHIKESDNQMVIQAITMTYNAFEKTLEQLSIVPVDTHKLFDPNVHEAISFIVNQDQIENLIVEVIKHGYMYKNNLLRPAQVIINKIA